MKPLKKTFADGLLIPLIKKVLSLASGIEDCEHTDKFMKEHEFDPGPEITIIYGEFLKILNLTDFKSKVEAIILKEFIRLKSLFKNFKF